MLLVQPPSPVRDVISLEGTEIPLNLAYLAAAIQHPRKVIDAYGSPIEAHVKDFGENEAPKAQILDMQLYHYPWKILKKVIRSFKPDIMGITAVTVQASFVEDVARIGKDLQEDLLTVFGGVHASALVEKSLREMPSIDVIVSGEGEVTFLEICSLRAQISSIPNREIIFKTFKDVAGIGIREEYGSGMWTSPARPLIKYLDLLPFPSRELLQNNIYRPLFVNYKTLPSTGILSSRGCPYNCSFCSKAVFKNSFRLRSPHNVLDEMKTCEKQFGMRDFRFFDDAVTINKKWLKTFCKLLIDEGSRFSWNAFSRVSDVSYPLLRLMKDAGCYHVKYGVETGSPLILQKMQKKTTLQQARDAIKNTERAGLESIANFILNYPGESMQSINKTIAFAKELNPTYAQFFMLKPLPGSRLYMEALSRNTIMHENWKLYGEEDPPLLRDQHPEEAVRGLLRRAYNQYYLRPRYLISRAKAFLRFPSLCKVRQLMGGIKTFIPRGRISRE
ncbi:MAG: radical SAM protein [Candidatus Sigynarchaeota archaeon]